MQYFLLLNTDLQTAHHLLHHEEHDLTHISSTSGIISSSHCSLLGATHSTVRVLILTHAAPAERLRRGSCRRSYHNKTHTYKDKTHPIIKQNTAGEALNYFFIALTRVAHECPSYTKAWVWGSGNRERKAVSSTTRRGGEVALLTISISKKEN